MTKIVDAVSYFTFPPGTLGFGIVALKDNRTPEEKCADGYTALPFIHKLSEKADRQPFTEEETAEIKADCEALVKLLKKFHHDSEFED